MGCTLVLVWMGYLSLPRARQVYDSMQVSANVMGPSPGGVLAWAKETDQFVAEKSRCEHNQMVSWCMYCSSEARTRDRKPGRVLPGKAGALPETMKHTAVENKHRNTYRDRRAPVATNCTGVKGVRPFASNLYTWCIDSGKVRRERDKEYRSQSCQKCQS